MSIPVKHNPQTLTFRPAHTGDVLVESVQIPNVPSDGDMTATIKSGLSGGPFAVTSVQSFDVVRIVEPGEMATFSVVVADALGVTLQWMFNGAIISVIGDSLILTGVSPANEGQYSVVVTNSAGTATSAPVTLRLARSFVAPAELVA